ncbi:MAG TPA: choice-of-anchor J domain-containing protein [Ignavibacteria bacterium]|jgi:hypothetical protein
MKRIFLLFCFALILASTAFSQRILINEVFETSGLNADSLPTNWAQFDVDQTNPTYPLAVWHVRDTSANFPGVNADLHSRANFYTRRSVSIPWRAGDPVADDWLITDSLRIQTGDSLIFWMLLGTPADSIIGFNLTDYIDTMQVWVCFFQDPGATLQKLATIRSADSNNVWNEYKYNLSPWAGQLIYIAFRYYMNTTVDGLWVNIDNVFVGNHSAIGIKPISTEIPKRFDLKQNYPNPFNPVTNIEFDIAKSEFVKLIIYNSTGQEVETLVNQNMTPGSYRVDFNAKNLASGTYFYRLITDDFVKTNKMVIVK